MYVLSKRVMVVAADKALQKRLCRRRDGRRRRGAELRHARRGAGRARIRSRARRARAAHRLDALTPPAPPVMPALASGRAPARGRAAGAHPAGARSRVDDRAARRRARPRASSSPTSLTAGQVTATVAKLLARDLFGVEKVMPWGARVYSRAGRRLQGEVAVPSPPIGEFAQAMGVRRKYREPIEQCIDEMLMNALYDAPVDDARQAAVRRDPGTRARCSCAPSRRRVVQYALRRRALRRQRARRVRHARAQRPSCATSTSACTPPSEQIDRKAGGAGLGLYLICQLGHRGLLPHLRRLGDRGRCAASISTAPRAQLRALGIFEERIVGARARPAVTHDPVAPRPPPRRSGAAVAAAARRRAPAGDDDLRGAAPLASPSASPRCPICASPRPRRLRIETDPPGALVYVDGRARGSAPLAVDAEAGRSYAVRAVASRPSRLGAAGHRRRRRLAGAPAPRSPRRHARRRDRAARRARLPRRQGDRQADANRARADARHTGPADAAQGRLRRVVGEDDGACRPASARSTTRRCRSKRPPRCSPSRPSRPPPTSASTAWCSRRRRRRTTPSSRPARATRSRRARPASSTRRAEITVGGGEHKSLQLKLVEGGTLALRVNLPAKVLVDDKAVGNAPIVPIGITAGEHTLALRGKTPAVNYSTKVSVEKGHTLDVRLDFAADHKVTGHIGDRPVADRW